MILKKLKFGSEKKTTQRSVTAKTTAKKTAEKKTVTAKKAPAKKTAAVNKKVAKATPRKKTVKTKQPSQALVLKENMPPMLVKKSGLSRLRSNESIDEINQKLALAFNKMHQDFSLREQQLEQQIQTLTVRYDSLEQKRKHRKFTLVLLFLAAMAGAYMLFVLTNMQNSMSTMTGDIGHMNGHVAHMSQNMQQMNNSMYYLNGNVAHMNGNVQQMTHAIQPIGDMAETTSPFMKAFRSFIPF
jgi:methyl-accepting chemotaxis protein